MAVVGEEFCDGMWWFPKHPNAKLSGHVTFSEDEGYSLSISGNLRGPILEVYQESEIVLLGKIGNNRDITVIGISTSSRKSNFTQINNVYKLKFVLLGFHFDKENIRFSSMILKNSNLDKWFYRPRLDAIWVNRSERKIFKYGRPIYINFDDNKLKIKNYSLVDYHWDAVTHNNIVNNNIFIKISLSKEKSLLKYLEYHHYFSNVPSIFKILKIFALMRCINFELLNHMFT